MNNLNTFEIYTMSIVQGINLQLWMRMREGAVQLCIPNYILLTVIVYMQSFNYGSTVVPNILFDKNSII